MENYILLEDQIQDKGKDLIVIDSNDHVQYVFRCACKRDTCMEFRCSITGSSLWINVIKWKYEI